MPDSPPSTTPVVGPSPIASSSAPVKSRSRKLWALLVGACSLLGGLLTILSTVSSVTTKVIEGSTPAPAIATLQPSLPVQVAVAGPPVTEAEYGACIKEGACEYGADRESCFAGRSPQPSDSAACVSWNEAVAFCRSRSRQLPAAKSLAQAAATPGFGWLDREWVKEGTLFNLKAIEAEGERDQRRADVGFHCAVE